MVEINKGFCLKTKLFHYLCDTSDAVHTNTQLDKKNMAQHESGLLKVNLNTFIFIHHFTEKIIFNLPIPKRGNAYQKLLILYSTYRELIRAVLIL